MLQRGVEVGGSEGSGGGGTKDCLKIGVTSRLWRGWKPDYAVATDWESCRRGTCWWAG